jgi:hypothetical protein
VRRRDRDLVAYAPAEARVLPDNVEIARLRVDRWRRHNVAGPLRGWGLVGAGIDVVGISHVDGKEWRAQLGIGPGITLVGRLLEGHVVAVGSPGVATTVAAGMEDLVEEVEQRPSVWVNNDDVADRLVSLRTGVGAGVDDPWRRPCDSEVGRL